MNKFNKIEKNGEVINNLFYLPFHFKEDFKKTIIQKNNNSENEINDFYGTSSPTLEDEINQMFIYESDQIINEIDNDRRGKGIMIAIGILMSIAVLLPVIYQVL